MKNLLSVLVAVTILAANYSVAGPQVKELIEEIRGNVKQMNTQVQTTREGISDYQMQSFSEALILVDNYKQFVLKELEEFLAISSNSSPACLESLPKPLYSIITEANWGIETCIGHMSFYGTMYVEDFEKQLNIFHQIASQHPISALMDLFSLEWNTEAGLQDMHEILQKRMENWDNVTAIELLDLKRRVQAEFQEMVEKNWPVCSNYGQKQVEKMFNDAINHLEGCANLTMH